MCHLARRVPDVRGKYRLIFKGVGGLVRHWPRDITAVTRQEFRFLHCDLEQYIFRELFVAGVFEADVEWILNRMLQPGDYVLDIGACFGYHTVTAAHRVGPAGCVCAVEPQSEMFALLQQNVVANSCGNVQMDCMAFSDHSGTLQLHRFAGLDCGHTSIATLDRTDYRTLECPAQTVDAYAEAHGIEGFALAKLDVEGAELQILQGAARLLSSPSPPMWILEINTETAQSCGYHPRDVLRLLRSHGYSFYRPAQGSLIRAIRGLEKCDEVHHGQNILCAVEAVHGDRLRRAGVNG